MKKLFLMMGLLCATMPTLADDTTPTTIEETELSGIAEETEEAEETVKSGKPGFSCFSSNLSTESPGLSEIPRFSNMTASSLLDLGGESKDERWAWNRLRNDVKPYTFMQDMTWVGMPLFVAGIIAKKEKKSFRQDYNNIHSNTRLLTHFKSEIDNYTQYFGPVLATGLKLGGVEGRSDWGRYAVSSLLGYAAMAAIVNGVKYTAKEMRPDGSTANSWPSGHTATSFVGATILHKEYGLTHSPWFSVAGYTIATATGIMRVLNNRHWVSDVLSGAGIGIISGELGYALGDLIFKKKGLRRNDSEGLINENHPSFFSVSMGVGLNNPTLDFDLGSENLMKFQTSTAVGVEAAYFLNKYVGLGGRLRVKSTAIKGWNNLLNEAQNSLNETSADLKDMATALPDQTVFNNMISDAQFTIESDHLTEFAADMGLYFNIPISQRISLGTKLLGGRSMMQELDLDAHFSGEVINMLYDAEIKDGEFTDLEITDFRRTGEQYDYQWDYATVHASNSTKWGTGLSLTYTYKHNFHWKVFADLDYTKKDFTLTLDDDSYIYHSIPNMRDFVRILVGDSDVTQHTVTKKMYQWTLGASFSVAF